MHFLTVVAIPGDTNTEDPDAIERAVGMLMSPHNENLSDDGWWDYWLIGGRWTGHFDGYDPDADPINQETCPFCEGTGVRKDTLAVEAGTHLIVITAEKHGENHPRLGAVGWCNGCNGRGTRSKWTLAPHEGDIMRRKDVRSDAHAPYYLVVGDEVFERDDEAWANLDPEALVVVVDCHN